MAETDGTITIGIELEDGTVKKAILKADEIGKAIGDSLGAKTKKSIDSSFTGLAIQLEFAARIAKQAFAIVSNSIGAAIDEAVQAENALTEFNKTLANSGQFTQAASDSFVEYAQSLQEVGTVSDDAVIKSASALVSIGKLSGQGLKDATKASVDLAQGLGVDLNTAFDLVAKAAAGNTAALSRYGIKVDENIPKSQRFASALAQINQKFGGLDEAQANTFGGSLKQLSNAFNDVLEVVGKVFTQSPALVAVFKFITAQLKTLGSSIAGFSKNGDLLRPIIAFFLELARVVTQNVLPAFELFANSSKFIFNAILTGVSALATGFSGVFLAIQTGLNKIGVVSDASLKKTQENFDLNKQALVSLADQTNESFTKIGTDFTITAAADKFVEDLTRTVEASYGANVALQVQNDETVNKTVTGLGYITDSMAFLNESVTVYKDGLKAAFVDLRDNAEKDLRSIAKASVDVFAKGVSGAFVQVGRNLATGKALFKGFGEALLGAFGDIAKMLGEFYIKLGIAKLAASYGSDTSGYASIAAGIALNILGGILGAAGSSGAGAGAGAAGGAPGAAMVENPDDPLTQQVPQDRGRKTEVAINIQGNVLDRKETGLEIASVLQEYFDTQDGVLARA